MTLLNDSLAPAVARALLHFLWEGTLIAGLLGVMLFALRRAPASSRYAAACAALVAMAGSFVFTLAAPDSGPERLQVPVFTQFALTHLSADPGPAVGKPIRLADWAVGVWLAGVLVLLLRRAGGWLTARRVVARASVTASDSWLRLLDGLRRRMGIHRAVALVESALVESPAVIGWFKPVILVPAGWLLGLAPADAETVLLHELAHVRRHDYLVNLIQTSVEDLLFYHPAVWWVGRVIRREREHCCDDAVIAFGADRRVYVRALAALEGMRAGEPAMAATGSGLAQRIRRLVRPLEGPRASAAPLVLITVLVCGGAIGLHAWPRPTAEAPVPDAAPLAQVPQPAAQQSAPTPLPGSPYQKWLAEDAAYIIQDDERAAFRRLQTDEEREHFIEQFWARRDPTPGTPANEMKEEHYRRIAYANERFAEAIPGWKTDRGRIYIVYGPPDEKEVHPTGEAGGPPFEEWLYKHIDGIGDSVIVRFVDENRSGSFRQTMDPKKDPQLIRPPRAGALRMEFERKAQPVSRDAALTVPRVQSNGDYVYRDGPASVRVGEGGATLIAVDGSEPRLVLRRVGRHEMEMQPGAPAGTVLRDDSSGTEYRKLITLPRGNYTLEGEVSQPAEVLQLENQRVNLTSRLNYLRQTHTDTHPQVREMQRELERAQQLLESQGAAAVRNYRVEFRVP